VFSWKEFEKTKAILSHVAGGRYRDAWGQHHLRLRPAELLEWAEFVKEDLGFFTLDDVAARVPEAGTFELVYNLLNMGSHQRLNLHLQLQAGEVIPSVVRFFANADWHEREQAELFGLPFDRRCPALLLPEGQRNFPLSPGARTAPWPEDPALPLPALRYNPNKSEAPYPEESYRWRSFDLLSPVTDGNFEAQLCFDPQRVVESRLRIGFHHQGLEGLLARKDVFQILQLVDRVNLGAAPSYSIAWAKTIEEMYRIRIPERAQAIRLIMLELARVADHLGVMAIVCRALELSEARLLVNAREKIAELFEKSSGSRSGQGTAVIGGVRDDLPPGWVVECQAVIDNLCRNLRIIQNSLLGQPRFRGPLEGSPVDAQSVLQWGVTGPAMRAAGLNFDLRKSQPFYFYRDIDFDIPVGIHGAAYDRYLIRYEEIRQSFRIITQVIDNLPLGGVVGEEFAKNPLELRAYFETLKVPDEWHYSALEAPAGEAGYLVQLAAGAPHRLKLKTPSFAIAQALGIFLRGLTEEQLRPSLLSLGLSRFEMDR
jgi:NADH-quinone oxidoreductase subunit C/D